MDEKELKNVTEAISAAREVMEKIKEDNITFEKKLQLLEGFDREKFEKANASLDKMEEKNQELTLKIKEQENQKKFMEDRLANLETEVVRKSQDSPVDYKKTNEYKAFNMLVKAGSFEKVIEHKDYLRTDVGEFGGFLVPEMISNELLKQITEISPVRRLSRIRTTQTKTLNIPIRTSLPTANYEGEAEAAPKTTPKYISETMTAHRHHVIVPVTRDQLNFSGFDMSQEITNDAVIEFARSEGKNFILGDGVKKPQGILSRVDVGGSNQVASLTTATSLKVSMDDVIKLQAEMKVGYSETYFFNRRVLAQLRVEKDSNGNYLWRIGGEDQPLKINGVPYVLMQDMPGTPDASGNYVAGQFPVGIGDFFMGYNVLDAIQMELIRDDVTKKDQAIVEFSWNRYNDGRVVLGEAFKVLKVKA